LSLLVALVVALTACSGGGPAPATGSDRAGGDAASSAADATDAADEPTASVEVGSSVRPLSDGELAAARQQLVEAADCPVGFDQLVVVEVPYLDFDEVSRRGTVIVNADVADDVASTFEQLHVAGFQIERVDAIDPLPNVILPFPGGVVRSGSKVGSRRSKTMIASTNDAFCPSLRAVTKSELPDGVNSVLELVINGIDAAAISTAMKIGIDAACRPGVVRISAGNYGGKLGPHHFHLQQIMGGAA